MLRVTVELFPHGSVRCGTILSQDCTINDGTGTLELGNYHIEDGKGKLNTQYIKGYKRSKGHRLLVAKAVQLLDKENKS